MNLEEIISHNIDLMQKNWAEKYRNLSASRISMRKELRPVLERYSSGKLLDAGAGNQVFRDIVEDQCEIYESLDLKDSEDISYVQDIRDTDLDSESFDTVFCRNVLEHIRNPGDALDEMSRITSQEGKIILTLPHLAYLHNQPDDYYRFTRYGVRELVEDTNLQVVEMREAGGLFSFLAYSLSTFGFGIAFSIPIIADILYYANLPLQHLAILLDNLTGNKTYFPLNYVIVLSKT
jgi:SAM-dependent methyltransferase